MATPMSDTVVAVDCSVAHAGSDDGDGANSSPAVRHDPPMDDRLLELVEARAIEQLMIRYIDRVDANDPVGAASCFTEDGVGIYSG